MFLISFMAVNITIKHILVVSMLSKTTDAEKGEWDWLSVEVQSWGWGALFRPQ